MKEPPNTPQTYSIKYISKEVSLMTFVPCLHSIIKVIRIMTSRVKRAPLTDK